MLNKFQFDLKEHLEMIVILIVIVSTIPIIYKFFLPKTKQISGKDFSFDMNKRQQSIFSALPYLLQH